jgi:hypothetical protein
MASSNIAPLAEPDRLCSICHAKPCATKGRLKAPLLHDRALALISYDPETGVFTWRGTRTPTCKAGTVAGTILRGGYRRIGLDGHYYLAGRLAWFMVHGAWPAHNIDHIDGKKDNDRFENLRPSVCPPNSANRVVSLARARELLSYEPATGIFIRRVRSGRRPAGTVAGCVGKRNGYRIIRIDRKNYRAARLAWFMTHGEWPPAEIDHINCDPTDDRLANLRPATPSQNRANTRKRRDSTSPYKGVTRRAGRPTWCVTVGKRHIGCFRTAEEACAAYQIAAREQFGEYARTS